MSTTDTVLMVVLWLAVLAFAYWLGRSGLLVTNLTASRRLRAKRCRNCRQDIWWEPGTADHPRDRRRDHEKECLS